MILVTLGIIILIVVLFTTHKTTHKRSKTNKSEVKEMTMYEVYPDKTQATDKIENNNENKNYNFFSLLKTTGYPKKIKTKLQKMKKRGGFFKNMATFRNYSFLVRRY